MVNINKIQINDIIEFISYWTEHDSFYSQDYEIPYRGIVIESKIRYDRPGFKIKLFKPVPLSELIEDVCWLLLGDDRPEIVTEVWCSTQYDKIVEHIPRYRIPKDLSFNNLIKYAFQDFYFAEIQNINAPHSHDVYWCEERHSFEKVKDKPVNGPIFKYSFNYSGTARGRDDLNKKVEKTIKFDNDGYTELINNNSHCFEGLFLKKSFISYLPKPGDLICGIVDRKSDVPRYHRWFVCSPQFVRFFCHIFEKDHAALYETLITTKMVRKSPHVFFREECEETVRLDGEKLMASLVPLEDWFWYRCKNQMVHQNYENFDDCWGKESFYTGLLKLVETPSLYSEMEEKYKDDPNDEYKRISHAAPVAFKFIKYIRSKFI